MTASAEATLETGSRRCWRCLLMFPFAAADLPRGQDEWWLCDPCRATLIPDGRVAG